MTIICPSQSKSWKRELSEDLLFGTNRKGHVIGFLILVEIKSLYQSQEIYLNKVAWWFLVEFFIITRITFIRKFHSLRLVTFPIRTREWRRTILSPNPLLSRPLTLTFYVDPTLWNFTFTNTLDSVSTGHPSCSHEHDLYFYLLLRSTSTRPPSHQATSERPLR